MTARKTSIVALALIAAFSLGCANYETPRANANFGPLPKNYDNALKRYFQTQLEYAAESRFEIGPPRRAFMNDGWVMGGDITWLGYLVDVKVQSVQKGFRRSESYIVRIRDNSIVDVHPIANTPVLHEM